MHQKFLSDVFDMIITSLVDSKTIRGEKSRHSTDIVSNGWHTSTLSLVIHTDMASVFCFEKKPRGFKKQEIRVSLTVLLLLYNSLETFVYTDDYIPQCRHDVDYMFAVVVFTRWDFS